MFQPFLVSISPDDTVATSRSRSPATATTPPRSPRCRPCANVVLPQTLGKVPGVQYAVAGETAGTHDFNEQMKARMPWVIAFVLALAFLLLLATFRSVVIPLTAIVLNLLSVGAAYGLLVLIFQHTWAQGILGFTSNHAITSWLPMFLFVVLFGLSMDYHVFILSRIKELRDGGLSTEEAVSRGIRRTAGTVTSAAIIMVAVFAIFGTLQLIMMKQLGVGPRPRRADRRDGHPRRAAARDDEAARRLELVHAALARVGAVAHAGRAEGAAAPAPAGAGALTVRR